MVQLVDELWSRAAQLGDVLYDGIPFLVGITRRPHHGTSGYSACIDQWSGRYDLLLHQSKDETTNRSTAEYTRELIVNHVSGRLKVAPEHTSDRVLSIMRKPSFEQFETFKKIFDRINREENLRQQLIPYFISSHPGCNEEDMAELAVITKRLDFHLEQVQDFTPTPMTVATEAWYSGFHPYTLEPIFSAKTQREKLAQRQFFFWYKPEERKNIINELRRIGRSDLIDKLYGKKR